MTFEQILDDLQQKYPPETALAVAKEIMASHYREDLYATVKDLLGYDLMDWSTHKEMIWALEAPTLNKIICVPRGCFKSTVALVGYSIWLLIRNPNLRILIDTELFTNSKTYMREIKAHLTGEKFTNIFGQAKTRDAKWDESEIIIGQRTVPRKEASITCGGVGTQKTGQHYDVIIGDDYNSPSNSDSKEKADKVLTHYRYNRNILEPNGIYVLIGTRYSELDLLGYVLRTELDLEGLAEGEWDEEALAQYNARAGLIKAG